MCTARTALGFLASNVPWTAGRRGYRATLQLTSDEAFGAHDPSLMFTDAIDNVPRQLRYVGAELEAENKLGDRRQFRVTNIEDGRLTVDANHPLAGRVLTDEVTVVGIRGAGADEIRSGEARPDLPVLR